MGQEPGLAAEGAELMHFGAAGVSPVACEVAGLCLIRHINGEHFLQAADQLGASDRKDDFHPVAQAAAH